MSGRAVSASLPLLLMGRRVFQFASASSSPSASKFAASLHTTAAREKQVPTMHWGVKPPKAMNEQECADRVLKAIKAWDRFPQDRAEKLTLDARFQEDLSFDSLDLVEITMAVEDEFGIEIEDDLAHEFKTPRDVLSVVADREMVTDNEGI